MKKKLLSILLSLAMVLTMIPFATMTAFAANPTIGDILNMCEGSNFPTSTKEGVSPSNAWTDGNGHYMYIYNNNGLYVQDSNGNYVGISIQAPVEADGNNYKRNGSSEYYSYKYVFNMSNGVLTSIQATYTDIGQDMEYVAGLSGTYAPPTEPTLTIADILPTDFPKVEGDFDGEIIPEGAWVDKNSDKKTFLAIHPLSNPPEKMLWFTVEPEMQCIKIIGEVVDKGTGVYEYIETDEDDGTQRYRLTFYTENEKLSHFKFEAINNQYGDYSALDGDYYPPTGDDDDDDKPNWSKLAKRLAIRAKTKAAIGTIVGVGAIATVGTVATVGTIATVKAIKNYKAEEASKVAEEEAAKKAAEEEAKRLAELEAKRIAELEAAKALVEGTALTQNKLVLTKKGSIKVSFNAADLDGVLGYEIERATDKAFTKGVKTYNTVNTTLTNAKNLKKGTRYYYRVRAKVELADGSIAYTDWSNTRYAKATKTR